MTDIEFKLVKARASILPCHMCGGHTGREAIVCEAPLPGFEHDKRYVLRACERCLKAGDIDTILKRHIEELEGHAQDLRDMIGRLKLPTYDDWQRATEAEEAASVEYALAEMTDDERAALLVPSLPREASDDDDLPF